MTRIPLSFTHRSPEDMTARSRALRDLMTARRSVREFSSDPVPREVLVNCIATAAQAPSGANKQPWTFALVTDADTKHRIRDAAEAEEREFYGGRAPQRWLDDLAAFDTDADKPFLDVAPALIVVFARRTGEDPDDKHYYVNESVGIATGMLLTALHNAGLATLTHTPSPMGFLRDILGRPANERAYLLIPVGHPAPHCTVPDIARKRLDEVLVEVGD